MYPHIPAAERVDFAIKEWELDDDTTLYPFDAVSGKALLFQGEENDLRDNDLDIEDMADSMESNGWVQDLGSKNIKNKTTTTTTTMI